MRWRRILKHLLTPAGVVRRLFPDDALDAIETAIVDGERRHGGEVCFAVEGCLGLGALWRGQSARERALELFATLHVWDTPDNNGVLVYLLLADHDIEIVADRGFNGRVGPEQWERVCRAIETRLRQGRFQDGVVTGLKQVADLIAAHFPDDDTRGIDDRLPNRPVVL